MEFECSRMGLLSIIRLYPRGVIVFYSYNGIKYYNIHLLSVWADCGAMLFYLVQL